MAPTRRSSRGSRRTPEGPAWDQVDLAPVVLIRAGEEILADRAVSRLLAQARQQDPSTEISTIEAAAYEPHQLDTLASPSLFGEPKLVLVPALEQMNDALLTDLLAYISAPAPDVVVLLRHNGGQRGRKLLNALAESPYPVVTIEAVKSPKDKAALVSSDARRMGRRMEPEAVGALVDALGSDPVPIVAALAMKIRQLARVAALGGRRGMSPKDLGMAPWQVDRARRELSGWSDDALAVAITAVARADAEVKGEARDPVHAVERAVLTICNARRGRLPTR